MTTILVIDDQEFIRRSLREILETEGHLVLDAENGEAGLNVVASNDVDLVITDILMPKKEGIETIIELRRKDPNVKVLAISGGGRVKNLCFLEIAQKLGAHKVLSKPFGPSELLNAVDHLLQSKVA